MNTTETLITSGEIKAVVLQAMMDFSSQSAVKHPSKVKADFFTALEDGLMESISPDVCDQAKTIYNAAFAAAREFKAGV